MPRIASEDAQTFTVMQDDGSVTPPIAKSDPAYTALKMQDGGFGGNLMPATDPNAGMDAPAPAPPSAFVGTQVPPDLVKPVPVAGSFDATHQPPVSAASAIPGVPQLPGPAGDMPPADGTPVPAPNMAPPVTGPHAGDVVALRDSETTTKHTAIPQADLNQIQGGFDKQQNAIGTMTGEYSQAAKERDAARVKDTGLRATQITDQEARAKAIADREGKFQTNLESAYNDVKNTEVKAKGVFDDKNVGQQIMAGIAIALGAAGQALSGSKTNYAIDIFDKAIERDLESQKVNLQKKKDQVSQVNMIQDAARKAGLSEDEAKAKVYEFRYGQIQSELQGVADRLTDADKKMQVQNMIGQLDVKKGEIAAKAHETVIENKTATKDQVLKPSDVKTAEGIPLGEAAKGADAAYKMNDSIQDLKSMNDIWKDKAGILSGRYNKFMAQHGLADPDTQELYRKFQLMLATQINKISGTGSSEKEADRLEKTLAQMNTDPASISKTLDEMEKANTRESYGIIRARVRDGVMPKDYQPLKLNSRYTSEFSKGVLTPDTPSTFTPGK